MGREKCTETVVKEKRLTMERKSETPLGLDSTLEGNLFRFFFFIL